MMNKNWIYNLKPGDWVLVSGNRNAYANTPDTTSGRVFKVTATMVILQAGKDVASPGMRFDRLTGTQKTSDSYRRAHLLEPTPEAVATHNAEWRKYKLVNRLKETDWNALTLDALDEIHATVARWKVNCDARYSNNSTNIRR